MKIVHQPLLVSILPQVDFSFPFSHFLLTFVFIAILDDFFICVSISYEDTLALYFVVAGLPSIDMMVLLIVVVTIDFLG